MLLKQGWQVEASYRKWCLGGKIEKMPTLPGLGNQTSRHDEQVMTKPQWAEVTVFWIQLSAWATSFQGQLLWPWGLFQLSDFCLFSLQMFIIEGQFIGLCSRLISACLFPWMYNLFLVSCYLLFRWFCTSFGGFLRMGTD